MVLFRFGYCGEDAGYCYPVQGCLLRGVEIQGGDLTTEEGGGGVHIEKGELDGCAFLCEENVLCGWYTYDKRIHKCFLKGERGIFTNSSQTSSLVSGSTQSGGCIITPREEPRAQSGPVDYVNYGDYDYNYNTLDYRVPQYSDYNNYDYTPVTFTRPVLRRRIAVGARRRLRNPFLSLLGK